MSHLGVWRHLKSGKTKRDLGGFYSPRGLSCHSRHAWTPARTCIVVCDGIRRKKVGGNCATGYPSNLTISKTFSLNVQLFQHIKDHLKSLTRPYHGIELPLEQYTHAYVRHSQITYFFRVSDIMKAYWFDNQEVSFRNRQWHLLSSSHSSNAHVFSRETSVSLMTLVAKLTLHTWPN